MANLKRYSMRIARVKATPDELDRWIQSLPASVEDAVRLSSTHYRGRSCKKGHPPLRYTKGGACVYCRKEESKQARQKRFASTARSILKVDLAIDSMRERSSLKEVWEE